MDLYTQTNYLIPIFIQLEIKWRFSFKAAMGYSWSSSPNDFASIQISNVLSPHLFDRFREYSQWTSIYLIKQSDFVDFPRALRFLTINQKWFWAISIEKSKFSCFQFIPEIRSIQHLISQCDSLTAFSKYKFNTNYNDSLQTEELRRPNRGLNESFKKTHIYTSKLLFSIYLTVNKWHDLRHNWVVESMI